MSEGTRPPPLYKTRLVVVGGDERLAYDIARQDGAPVAVVGPNAVACPRCKAPAGDECSAGQPHLERVRAMASEVERLRAEMGR